MSNEYSIGRLRGKLCLVWRDAAGTRHRHSLGTSDKVEAGRLAPAIYAELTRPKGTSVGELWQAFANDMRERAIATRLPYSWKALQSRFGRMDARMITVEDCEAHIAERRSQGRADGTIKTELNHLRIALHHAEKRRRIERAPYIKLPPNPRPKEHHLTRDETRALIGAAVTNHVRLAIILLYGTAARVSAILGLTWSRCDFERKQIDLRDPEITRPHKGRAIVPMTRMVEGALLESRAGALTDYVIEWAGERVASVKKGVTSTGNRAGLKVSPHVLRHTAAVHMAEDGIDMEVIAQFLGHSSVDTTRRIYARFSPTYLRAAAAALDFDLPPTKRTA